MNPQIGTNQFNKIYFDPPSPQALGPQGFRAFDHFCELYCELAFLLSWTTATGNVTKINSIKIKLKMRKI
jgi:hypothetical protein